MSNDVELQQLETRINAAKNTEAQTKGALNQSLGSLQAEFGVSTLEEAEAMMAQYQIEAEAFDKQATEAVDSLRTVVNGAGV